GGTRGLQSRSDAMTEPSVDVWTEPIADIAGDAIHSILQGRRGGGQLPPFQRGARTGGAGGPGVDGPVGGPHRVGATDDDRWRGAGGEGEGGGLLATDDEAGGRGVGAEVGEVVLGEVGGDVAIEGVGVLGGHGEPDFG